MVWPYPEGHTCRTCKRVFVAVQRCQEHEREAHPPTWSCCVCELKTHSTDELILHLETHLPLVCCHPRCCAVLGNRAELIAHRVIDRLQIVPVGYSATVQVSAKISCEPMKVPESPNPALHAKPAFLCSPMGRNPLCSPLSTPKRRYPDSPMVHASGSERTPTVKTPRTSSLTPAFDSLRLGLPPLNETMFQSCIEEDELMVTALDISGPTTSAHH